MRTLFLQREGGEPHTITIGAHLHIGRGPHNGVVLKSVDVSWSHTVLRIVDEQLVAEDLGSRNGTWVDGRRIARPTIVGQSVRIGDYLIRPRDDSVEAETWDPVFLEEVENRVRYPLGEGSFVIGDVPGANIRVAGQRPVVLRIHEGRVSLGDEALTLPWNGRLAGVTLHVFSVADVWSPTQDRTATTPWRMRVTLEPPAAHVEDLRSQRAHTVRAPNRVSLLFFLARALADDSLARTPEDQLGWRGDEDAVVAVWGRAGVGGPRNRLNTLVYRLRNELTDGGLGDDLIEKKAGWVRLLACEADL